MNIGELIGGVIGKAAQPVVDYFKVRAELRSKERIRSEELKDAQHTRQINLLSQGLAADANWEQTFAEQAMSSWKDEYTLLVVSIPLVLCFVPGGQATVTAGFEALSGTPVWYQVMVQTLFYATVGIRLWRRSQYDTP
jgi:hypothetical protein